MGLRTQCMGSDSHAGWTDRRGCLALCCNAGVTPGSAAAGGLGGLVDYGDDD